LARADEDSILNFLFFGTTFTKQPRMRSGDIAKLDGEPGAVEVVRRRLDDLVAGIALPGGNERLSFARKMVERKDINPTSAAGRDQTRFYLGQIMTRALGESKHYDTVMESLRQSDALAKFAANSTLFHDRGLSPDTSIFVNFGTEQALEAMKSQGILGAGQVRRVAIVGPGLDFTDKQEGYDFYPPQTIQPFAVIDSLVRLGLAMPDGVQMVTLDLSPRINQHLEAARQRARTGRAYIVELPRDTTERWNPGLVKYWERFGDRIGTATAVARPADAGSLQVRAIRIRPALVSSTIPWDVNVVLQRLQSLEAGGLFDLIIATNVLIYYDVFEQSLALANVAKMLRPGGLFLSNDLVFELAATPMNLLDVTDVVYSDIGNGDRFIWYQRQ
ncbi:MAG TPA: class I SAM-dependent methyltransferase, partial [Vicinamibacterales bacterium]|nr:class I SAM-dependent methyltransferase [Vicinamibacterales bacterium]